MPFLHSEDLNLQYLFKSVRRRLAEVTAAFWTDLEVYNALNKGIRDISIKSRCLKKTVTVTTVSGTREYDLKDEGFADIIDISEDGVEFNTNGTSRLGLDFKTIAQLNKESPGWRDIAASIPRNYYYNKNTKTIGLDPKPNATNAGAYLFPSGYHRAKVLHAGTAAAGASTTLTLAAASSTVNPPSTVDDYYNGIFMEIADGPGEGEKAEITDYVGSTRVCTVNFTTTPTTSSIYGMVPEIPQEAHELLEPYALWKLFSKGGSRTVLANSYRDEYFANLSSFMGDYTEIDDEKIVKDTYR